MIRLIKLNSLLIFFILLLLNNKGLPSDLTIKAEQFNIESGLSQTAVNALHIDSFGFLWIGTQDGLNRYDGYSFKIYRNNPLDTTSICNNNITSICEDVNGNLWIGTWEGLSLYDRSTETFKNYYYTPADPSSLSSSRIYSVYQDHYGVIWIKTLESLDRYNPSTDTFVRYPHFSDPFTISTDNSDFAILEDSQKVLWVGTKDGLMYFDRDVSLFKRFSHSNSNPKSLTNNRVKDIFEDSDGRLWVATASGLNMFNRENEDFVRFLHDPNDHTSLRDNLVNVIYQDSNGDFWVGTDKGLSHLNLKTNEFSSIRIVVNDRELYAATITTIVEDNSDILWIGTLSGLIKLDRKTQKFQLYDKKYSGENLFSGNLVASLFEDNNGLIWVGTWGTGLHIFDRKTNRVTKYSEVSKKNTIVNDYVHVIYQKQDGEILIGTRNGVQVYNRKNQQFVDFFEKHGIDGSSVFDENRVYAILQDSLNALWFATRNGLHRFDGEQIQSFFHEPDNPKTISSNEIHCIALKGKMLWVGTFNGLNIIDIETLEIKKKYHKPPVYNDGELISNDIVSLLVSSSGDIWIGTNSGLHRYNLDNDNFTLLTEVDGLPNNLINAIEEDRNGNIWVSTNWGLASIKPDNLNINSYGVRDGLQSYEFNVGASYTSQSGELFFGGISGFNTFYPESITINEHVPPVVITSFEIFGHDGFVEVPTVGNDEITIDQLFSLINIEFAALDFTRPESNQYKYKMEGLENEWISIKNRRSATFSNLGEGRYTFRVIGSNSDNVWNEDGISLTIFVKTTFWKSKLAYWLYTVLFIVSLILFLRVRTRMLRKTRRLLKEREFTMTEIEKQKEELLFKNKNITDSINYAKRIQESLIPKELHFKKILPESFILYMPKDIVSGDFYWINETKNKIFVAVIDCTGHGVPGAFMSIIGIELLRNITNVMGVNDAAEILNRLDKGVHDIFSKNTDETEINVKDGMDVSFCVIDKENNTLQFAGAFCNLYIIRDSKIIEVKGDRYSVGIGYEPSKPLFTNHLIPVQPDDMIYMFTDGYVDQFGGPEGKKFKFRRFRHLLLNIHKYPLEIQRKHLIGSINEWKGDQEQVDDILIIGIKSDLSCLF